MPGTGVLAMAMSAGPTVRLGISGKLAVGERGVVAHRLHQRRPPQRPRSPARAPRGRVPHPARTARRRARLPLTAARRRAPAFRRSRRTGTRRRTRAAPCSRRAARRTGSSPRITVPCVCTTPFGSALDPEVYVTCARSAGTTSASSACEQIVVDPRVDVGGSPSRSTGVAHPRSAPPVIQIARSDGVSGRKSRGPGASASPGTLSSSICCMSLPEHGARGDQRVDVADPQHLADLGRAVGGRERHHERADAARPPATRSPTPGRR